MVFNANNWTNSINNQSYATSYLFDLIGMIHDSSIDIAIVLSLACLNKLHMIVRMLRLYSFTYMS